MYVPPNCDSCKRPMVTCEFHIDVIQVWKATDNPYSQHMEAPYRRRKICRVCMTYVDRMLELPVYRELQDVAGDAV